MPSGAADTTPVYPYATSSVTVTVTGTTNAWSSESTITPQIATFGTMWGTWIAVEITGDSAGVTGYLNAISIAESVL